MAEGALKLFGRWAEVPAKSMTARPAALSIGRPRQSGSVVHPVTKRPSVSTARTSLTAWAALSWTWRI